MRACFRVLVFGLVSLVAVSASAQEDAKTLFRQGQTAYQQGDYELSIEKWSAAYKLDPKPLIQYNLSQAYERLGRLVEAEKSLELYLRDAAADDVYQADARAKRDAIRRRLENTGIQIVDAPDGAKIMVNETSWGLTPRPDMIRVAPGNHTVWLKKDGYEEFRAVVSVTAGKVVTVNASMITQKTTTPPALEQDKETGSGMVVEKEKPFPWLEVGLMGGGGLVAVTGLVVGLAAVSAAGDEVDGTDEAKKLKGQALVGDIMVVVGVAAAATGAALLIFGGDDDETVSEGTAVVAPYVGPTGGGVTAAMSF